jgi:molybdopterin-guanine dinucleotide biosynthesis protein A
MQPDRVRARFDTLVRLDMTSGPALAAAILAGGHARRLGGVNKGTLTIGTTAIIDRELDVLRALATDVFVVGREDPAWDARGLRVVHDEMPDAGPLGGIYTAIRHSPCERTLVVACDMPFLSSAFLLRMAAVDDVDLVIPRSERGYEPLCAIYSRTCEGDIHARLTRGEYEASTLPVGIRIAEIDVGNDLVFVNINTPHDYERAKGLIEWKPESTQDRITTGRTGPMTDADS